MNSSSSLDASLLIVGAGPAGLLAAWAAAQRHLPAGVRVVDRMPSPGAKLAVTGGGRGNMSHLSSEEEFALAFGRHGRFAIPAFRALPPEALRHLLADIGIPTTVDPSGRIYPKSQSAAQTRDALYNACIQSGVRFLFQHPVKTITPPENPSLPWRVDSLTAHSVLLATGGQSTPALGSDGTGFRLASALGYDIVPPAPALTSFHTVETWPALHSGLSLPDVTLTLPALRGREASERGEILFTHRGISGPAVLNLSGRVARLLLDEHTVQLHLALIREKPDFLRLRKTDGQRTLHSFLSRLLPRTLAGTLLHLSNIPEGQTFSRLSAEQENSLCLHLFSLPLAIRNTGGFQESMATAGGVSLKQVHPDTLEGRLTPRLHFAGELLNLDGPTGGWNLQWAFCSGYLAGTLAART